MKFSKKFYSATTEYTTFFKEVPAPYIRKNLELTKKPEKAEILVTGLGFYKIFVNGKDITKGLLAPYIANPDDFIYYDLYDLSPYLNEGKNVLAFTLGNGIINCPGGLLWDFDDADYRNAPMVAFTLDIDGEITEADETLKCAPSATLFDDLRCGEFYDARKEIENWNSPEFDDSNWDNVIKVLNIPRGTPALCEAEPIKVRKELIPVSITPNIDIGTLPAYDGRLPEIGYKEDEIFENGGYLYDFGVNTAGIFRLKLKNTKEGQKVVLQFGENLKENGLYFRDHNFYPLRYTYRCTYTCKGGETEIWEPSFHYQGFRYCIIYGLEEAQATNKTLTYLVANSDLKVNADFNCSDEISNKIWKAGIEANLANFYYFPTDCPHREKNGWTGDASLSAEQMMVTLTPIESYRQWLKNIRAAQSDIGELPGIVPTYKWGYGTGPCWDAVIVNLPYYAWLYTGDTEIIKENSKAIMRFIEYLYSAIEGATDDRFLRHGGLTDWCPAKRPYNMATAPKEFSFLCTNIDVAKKAMEIFEALGVRFIAHKNFAKELYERSRLVARKYFVDTNRCLACGNISITAQAMALSSGVFEDGEKDKAFSNLVKMLEKRGNAFDVGILGARVLFHVLSDFGRTDLAYDLITGTDHPSYGSWIEAGDTSFTEGFYLKGAKDEPSSHNHHMFGDVLSWYIKRILGIWVNPYRESANDILIKPDFIPQLKFAEGYENIPAGEIYVKWEKLEDGKIKLTVKIPENAKGYIIIGEGYQFSDGMCQKEAKSGEYILYKDNEFVPFEF
ncbi:MAG: hypothetical protein E7564_06465 [Ruminococcaceae bacterium]|nr:hypothetical protein [Oscillospiraceae bacterium]